MVKGLVTILISVVSFTSIGQHSGDAPFVYFPDLKRSYRQPGLLSASMTFSPGTMLNRNSNNFYLSGFAEYQMDNKVSLRGDTYVFLNSPDEVPFVQQGFRTYFGAFYHLNQALIHNWDVKFGFQPGITVFQPEIWVENAPGITPESRFYVSPSFSLSAGVDYYVWKYFHFFANVAYVNSNLRGTPTGGYRTDEILFSAGLGFQIKTLNR